MIFVLQKVNIYREKTTFQKTAFLCAEYNPATNTWEAVAEMPVPRADHAMLAFQVKKIQDFQFRLYFLSFNNLFSL